MQNFNEKRPERVLVKGASQEMSCPNCGKSLTVHGNVTSAQCTCGQLLNWGLRKA